MDAPGPPWAFSGGPAHIVSSDWVTCQHCPKIASGQANLHHSVNPRVTGPPRLAFASQIPVRGKHPGPPGVKRDERGTRDPA
jgi:hypothetical protein